MPREQQLMLCALCDPLPFSLAFPHILCHGSKLAQRNVGAPSLDMPRARLDGTLGSLIWLGQPTAGG